MKVIDVLAKLANDEIKDGTELEVHDSIGRILKYTFYEKLKAFRDKRFDGMDRVFSINNSFLNLEVELIPPKEKKYLIKLNVQGLREDFAYLNYTKSRNCVVIHGKVDCATYKTRFTKSELESIQPVREFLEDMEGKYELIEVEE